MTGRSWRVGALARATGLTVRALHHYEAVGLLAPAERTEGGHRVYGAPQVRRLYRIMALRRLGLRLDEIGAWLARDGPDPLPTLRAHLAAVERELEAAESLRSRLVALLAALERRGAPSSEDLIELMEAMTMIERHYTPEQLAALDARRRQLGDQAIAAAQREWAELIAAVEAERARGTDPASPVVRELAARWRGLIEAFTGGDPGIAASLERMYREEGVEAASRGAVSEELSAYLRGAWAAAPGGP
jgi:DNA-binding transcriptional MerR regulator